MISSQYAKIPMRLISIAQFYDPSFLKRSFSIPTSVRNSLNFKTIDSMENQINKRDARQVTSGLCFFPSIDELQKFEDDYFVKKNAVLKFPWKHEEIVGGLMVIVLFNTTIKPYAYETRIYGDERLYIKASFMALETLFPGWKFTKLDRRILKVESNGEEEAKIQKQMENRDKKLLDKFKVLKREVEEFELKRKQLAEEAKMEVVIPNPKIKVRGLKKTLNKVEEEEMKLFDQEDEIEICDQQVEICDKEVEICDKEVEICDKEVEICDKEVEICDNQEIEIFDEEENEKMILEDKFYMMFEERMKKIFEDKEKEVRMKKTLNDKMNRIFEEKMKIILEEKVKRIFEEIFEEKEKLEKDKRIVEELRKKASVEKVSLKKRPYEHTKHTICSKAKITKTAEEALKEQLPENQRRISVYFK